jgi:hypothetical protein
VKPALVQAIGPMKSANLVVRVATTDPAGRREAVFRGVDASTNWNSSENEIQEAFDQALAHLRQQIDSDLRQHCSL